MGVLLFFAGVYHGGLSHYYPKIRVSAPTILYLGPDENYPIKSNLAVNDEVVLLKKRDTWYYVSSTAGSGWIKSDRTQMVRNLEP
jgi:hypothetical protein